MKTKVRDAIITSSVVIMTLGLIGAIIPMNVTAQDTQDTSSTQTYKIEIHNQFNNPNEKMTHTETTKKGVEVKTDPPKTIKAGDKGSFEIESKDIKSGELKVGYTIEKGQKVSFGFDSKGCFANTDPGVHSSHSGCYDKTMNFYFKEGGEPPQ